MPKISSKTLYYISYGAIFLKSLRSKDIKTDITNCQIHKYKYTNTALTKCHKCPTYICYVFEQLMVQECQKWYSQVSQEIRSFFSLHQHIWQNSKLVYDRQKLLLTGFCTVQLLSDILTTNISELDPRFSFTFDWFYLPLWRGRECGTSNNLWSHHCHKYSSLEWKW